MKQYGRAGISADQLLINQTLMINKPLLRNDANAREGKPLYLTCLAKQAFGRYRSAGCLLPYTQEGTRFGVNSEQTIDFQA